jgi:hypothetical protein
MGLKSSGFGSDGTTSTTGAFDMRMTQRYSGASDDVLTSAKRDRF